MKKIILILMILGALIAGCAQRNVVKTSDLPKNEVPVVAQKQTAGKQAEEQKTLKGMNKSNEISGKDLSKEQASGIRNSTKALETKFHDIYFKFDNYAISPDSKLVLKQMSETLLKDKSLKIIIEGHCDQRGTTEYNLALGDKRADAVRRYLSTPNNLMD